MKTIHKSQILPNAIYRHEAGTRTLEYRATAVLEEGIYVELRSEWNGKVSHKTHTKLKDTLYIKWEDLPDQIQVAGYNEQWRVWGWKSPDDVLQMR